MSITTPTVSNLRRLTIAPALLTLLLAGCGALPDRNGFFTRGDGAPRHNVDINAIPDAEPRIEARSRYGNPDSYVVRGKRYHVRTNSQAFQQHGIASWYGTKFHGRKTSSGEAYDMFAMTAAHKTLPLPTWVEVFNHDNQKRIIVKVNDRGPFVSGRIIDLSYAAATRLGVVATGTARVTIQAIDPAQYLARKHHRPSVNSSVNTAATSTAIQPLPRTNISANANTGAYSGLAPTASVVASIPVLVPIPASVTVPAKPSPAIAKTTTSASRPLTIGTFYLQVAAFSERRNAEQLRQRLLSLKPGNIQINPNQPPSQNSQALYRVRIGPLTSLSEAGRIAAQITSMGLGEPKIMLD